jgi:hypothetical protein
VEEYEIQKPNVSSMASLLQPILKRLEALEVTHGEVVAAVHSFQRKSFPAGSPRQSQFAPADREYNDLCFYHAKFGRAAMKCRPPCRWSSKNC